jgi:hypothetical protein
MYSNICITALSYKEISQLLQGNIVNIPTAQDKFASFLSMFHLYWRRRVEADSVSMRLKLATAWGSYTEVFICWRYHNHLLSVWQFISGYSQAWHEFMDSEIVSSDRIGNMIRRSEQVQSSLACEEDNTMEAEFDNSELGTFCQIWFRIPDSLWQSLQFSNSICQCVSVAGVFLRL